MKKGIFVMIAVMTMLILQVGAAFGVVDIYLEGGNGQKGGGQGNLTDNDWTSIDCAIEVPVGRVKGSLELNQGVFTGNNIDYDTTASLLKFGYAFINKERMCLDATLSYYQFSLEDSDYDTILPGVDFRYNFSKHFYAESSVGIKSGMKNFKLKGYYMPNSHFGFSLGYHGYGFSEVNLKTKNKFNVVDTVDGLNGWYAGLIWRCGHAQPTK